MGNVIDLYSKAGQKKSASAAGARMRRIVHLSTGYYVEGHAGVLKSEAEAKAVAEKLGPRRPG